MKVGERKGARTGSERRAVVAAEMEAMVGCGGEGREDPWVLQGVGLGLGNRRDT